MMRRPSLISRRILQKRKGDSVRRETTKKRKKKKKREWRKTKEGERSSTQ